MRAATKNRLGDFVSFILLPAAVAATFFGTFKWMYARFTEPDSYYSHGFLIPFFTAYVILTDLPRIRKMHRESSPWGIALLIAALAGHISIGLILGIGFVSGICLILALIGSSLYLFGKRITNTLLFPLSFLIFMVPVPQVMLLWLTFNLKMFVAHIAVWAVGLMKLNIVREGSILYLPNGMLTVENECSGINSLISLFTLSVAFAYFLKGNFLRKAVMVSFSLPIAVLSNMGRIVFLIIAAYIYGTDTATRGVLHYGAGVILWGVAFGSFIMLYNIFKRQEEHI